VPSRINAETLGKMPELRRMTVAPFPETRQTLLVLLDRLLRVDDFHVEVTECADL
jgi:hypothetical protein